VLPFLAADTSVSVSDLLRDMHHELGGDDHAETVSEETGRDGSCGCGERDDSRDVELDARVVPHAIRHATIFGALEGLGAGKALVLVAPHDPLPLLAQLEQRSPGTFEVSYLERGPVAWPAASSGRMRTVHPHV
jgi:uncharacterized protein (DUF2249 family)